MNPAASRWSPRLAARKLGKQGLVARSYRPAARKCRTPPPFTRRSFRLCKRLVSVFFFFAYVAATSIAGSSAAMHCSISGGRVYKGLPPHSFLPPVGSIIANVYTFDAYPPFIVFLLYRFPRWLFLVAPSKAVVFVEMARRRTPHMGAPLTCGGASVPVKLIPVYLIHGRFLICSSRRWFPFAPFAIRYIDFYF